MATKTTGSDQIKSRKRVKEHGEVFTNPREVKAMCDLVGDPIEKPETTVLEPACGTGNFLAEILERKLSNINYIDTEEKRQQAVIAVASLYGVDIMDDNVKQTRTRLFGIIARHLTMNLCRRYFGDDILSKTLVECDHVLFKNIQHGDFLKDNITFRSWQYKVLKGVNTERIYLGFEETTKEQIMAESANNK